MKSVSAAHPCTVCQKRKVKCDRNQPVCHNCAARNEIDECIYENKRSNKRVRVGSEPRKYDTELYALWNDYENLWLRDVMGQKQNVTDNGMAPGLDNLHKINHMDFYDVLISKDLSFEILNYSLERFGWLYFGLFSDVGEILVEMEKFWSYYESSRLDPTEGDKSVDSIELFQSIDQLLWDLILRSILTTTVFFMPVHELQRLLNVEKFREYIADLAEKSEWDENTRFQIFSVLLRLTLQKLLRVIFTINNDLRIVQIFLILSNTSFHQIYPTLGTNLLVHSIHLTNSLGVKDFKLKINDNATSRLRKLTFQNIWFRLSTIDYLTSTPYNPINLHSQNKSIIKQNYLLTRLDTDMVDVYDIENTLESLRWEILSLDRDLEETNSPSLKTLASIKDLLILLDKRIQNISNESSINKKFEIFILKLKSSFVLWKTLRAEFTQHGVASGFQKLCFQSQVIIGLFLTNIQDNVPEFNSYFLCFYVLSRISAFHSFYEIFFVSEENEQLSTDCIEIFAMMSHNYQPLNIGILSDLSRFGKLKTLKQSVKVIDGNNKLNHPVHYILREDIQLFRRMLGYKKNITSSFDSSIDDNLENSNMSKEFLEIVNGFRSSHPLFVETWN